MLKFDRTGHPPVCNYDLGPELRAYDMEDGCRIYEIDASSAEDGMTVRICGMRLEDGRAFIWGEDSAGDRCWIREDDGPAQEFLREAEAAKFPEAA